MRFPIQLFYQLQKDNPHWSDWTCFQKTIEGLEINRRQLRKYFNNLVDKEEYLLEEKNDLMDFIMSTKKGSYSP